LANSNGRNKSSSVDREGSGRESDVLGAIEANFTFPILDARESLRGNKGSRTNSRSSTNSSKRAARFLSIRSRETCFSFSQLRKTTTSSFEAERSERTGSLGAKSIFETSLANSQIANSRGTFLVKEAALSGGKVGKETNSIGAKSIGEREVFAFGILGTKSAKRNERRASLIIDTEGTLRTHGKDFQSSRRVQSDGSAVASGEIR